MAQADYVTIPIRTSIPGVRAKPSTSPAPAAHAEFIANRAQNRPHPMPLYPGPVGLEDRADHLRLTALSVCVSVVLEDTGAVLADLSADVIGAIQQSADGMAGSVA
jgi:hypothetical protein